jgi:hypothetical protein
MTEIKISQEDKSVTEWKVFGAAKFESIEEYEINKHKDHTCRPTLYDESWR